MYPGLRSLHLSIDPLWDAREVGRLVCWVTGIAVDGGLVALTTAKSLPTLSCAAPVNGELPVFVAFLNVRPVPTSPQPHTPTAPRGQTRGGWATGVFAPWVQVGAHLCRESSVAPLGVAEVSTA